MSSSPTASIARPALAALLVTTMSCVTECSEGDGHLRTYFGAGSHWASWHAMPWAGAIWVPDRFEMEWWGVATALGIALAVAAVFVLAARYQIGRASFAAIVALWIASWAGTFLPFPFLFFGFLAQFGLPFVLVILGIEALVARRRSRAPP
jgi:hypothetical protein